nr:MAG TPA: hypothetical protein [Caudoviricetes sp.]DAM73882.1 MAG TPA: hypothetical protein [Caudoviricetes sp.]
MRDKGLHIHTNRQCQSGQIVISLLYTFIAGRIPCQFKRLPGGCRDLVQGKVACKKSLLLAGDAVIFTIRPLKRMQRQEGGKVILTLVDAHLFVAVKALCQFRFSV